MRPTDRVPPMARKSPLPPYFVWRDGRPRWQPGPAMRARGYKGRDLKVADGAWLTKGAAIDAAERINAAVAGEQPLPVPAARSLDAVFAAYQSKRHFKVELAERTRKDYLDHMSLLSQWAGDRPVASISREEVEDLRDALIEGRGLSRGGAILRTLRLTMNFARDTLRWIDWNVANKLGVAKPKGRTVIWTPAEIRAFVAAADWCGRPSQGDALLMAVCTAQQRVDILTAPPMVREEGVYRMTRRKTGRVCYIPASKPLEARLAKMRARNAKKFPGVTFSTELVCTDRGTPYKDDGYFFNDEHRAVRALASGLLFSIEDAIRALMGAPPRLRNLPFTPVPSLWHKQFADTRDTGVTMIFAFTKDIGRTATVSGHSLKRAQEIIDEHYFARSAELARDAENSFDALLA